MINAVEEMINNNKTSSHGHVILTFGANGPMWLGGMNGVDPLSPGCSRLDA